MEQNYRAYYSDHVQEVQKRWELALEAESFMAALVHSGSPMYSFLDDYEYAFRPNPHFLAWLPLTSHPDSVLLVMPGRRPVLFYYQPVDYWYLPPSDPEPYWADHFDIEVVRDSGDWRKLLKDRLGDADLSLGDVAAIGGAPVLKEVFDEKWINPEGLINRLHIERTRKTPYEVACISASARLAARAHVEAEQAFREGESEHGIHMRYLAACGHTDAQLPYNNIVALNSHGAVLHYQARELKAPERSLSFLLDAGCTVNAYASDITRTYAGEPGDFADLVAAMDAMQQELTGEVCAGLDYRDLHLETHRRIAALLESFDIITVSADEAFESGLSSVFYPHGLGHFLGLQTHDVAGLIDDKGKEIPRPDGHPFLRLTRVLEAGNLLTIEPGLYFIAPLLKLWREEREPAAINWSRVEQLAPYGGVRIEDNVHVTESGCDNLTRAAFAELA
jgi:Xaa-Pro dipeptidase